MKSNFETPGNVNRIDHIHETLKAGGKIGARDAVIYAQRQAAPLAKCVVELRALLHETYDVLASDEYPSEDLLDRIRANMNR